MPTRHPQFRISQTRWMSAAMLALLVLSGCDKLQISQVGSPAANPTAAPVATPATVGSSGNTATSAASPTPVKLDPKAIVAKFLQKVSIPTQVGDADLTEVTDAGADLDGIRELNLAGSKITDKGMATLSKFTKLQQLELGATTITHEGLKVVKEFSELHLLVLGNTPIDDRGMAQIGGQIALRELNLQNTKITDFGLNELRELKDLEVLDVSATTITGAGFEKFRGHKHLKVLRAHHTPLQSEAMKFLVGCPLEELNVAATAMADPGMIYIGKLNELKHLDLGYCNVTDFGVNKLGPMKDLEYISVRNNSFVSNLLFAKIQKCKNLKRVVADGTRIKPIDAANLQKLIPEVNVSL